LNNIKFEFHFVVRLGRTEDRGFDS
jgi:hypothetical protein